jgi:hypothetical protein
MHPPSYSTVGPPPPLRHVMTSFVPAGIVIEVSVGQECLVLDDERDGVVVTCLNRSVEDILGHGPSLARTR